MTNEIIGQNDRIETISRIIIRQNDRIETMK